LVIPSNKLPFLESRPRDWARSRSTGNSVEMSIFLPIYPYFAYIEMTRPINWKTPSFKLF
jgi:hypothetical protein